jgi:hypothetical protein
VSGTFTRSDGFSRRARNFQNMFDGPRNWPYCRSSYGTWNGNPFFINNQ